MADALGAALDAPRNLGLTQRLQAFTAACLQLSACAGDGELARCWAVHLAD